MTLLLSIIDFIFWLLTIAIFIRVILSWLPVDPYSTGPLTPVIDLIRRITDPILEPIHRVIPPIGMIDISPIIALALLQILQALIHNLFRAF